MKPQTSFGFIWRGRPSCLPHEMYQSKLDQFFPITRPSPVGKGFLDLPYNIRREVYYLARVVRSCPVYLDCKLRNQLDDADLHLESEPCVARDILDRGCDCYEKTDPGYTRPIPMSLFFSCKKVSEEVSDMFYRENRFYIRYNGPGSFLPLHQLRHKNKERLRFLHITLHELCRDPHFRECVCYKMKGQHPLKKSTSRLYRDLINEWRKTVQSLWFSSFKAHIELCLICDTYDPLVACDIVDPLVKQPFLYALSIRFAPPQALLPSFRVDLSQINLFSKLRHIANDASKQATARLHQPQDQGVRWDILPRELQLHILQFTDLVAPFHLAWSPGQGLFDISEVYSPYYEKPFCEVCDGVRISCCLPVFRKGGTWVRQCKRCWKFPAPLFLVNHAFNEEATRIFWSRNKFVVLPLHSRSRFSEDPMPVIGPFTPAHDSISFTSAIPRKVIQHIRFLQISVPDFSLKDRLFLQENVKSIRRFAKDRHLTFTLDLRSGRFGWGQEDAERWWEMINPLISTFAPWRELKHFFVHVGSFSHYDPFFSMFAESIQVQKQLEDRSEKSVKGEDYESPNKMKQAVLGGIRPLDESDCMWAW